MRLAEEVRQLTEQRDHEAEFEAMVARAKGLPLPPPLAPPPAGKRKTPPEKRWLWAVPGMAAAGLLAGRWWRRAIAGTATAAVLTAGGLSADLMAPAPAAQVPAHHRIHRRHGTAPAAVPLPLPPRKRRRKPDAVAGSPPPRPSRSASPSPSATDPDPGPSPTVTPLPVPSPTVVPLPVPLPTPSCLPPHGHHCHPGDVLEPLEEVTGGALRGLTGLS